MLKFFLLLGCAAALLVAPVLAAPSAGIRFTSGPVTGITVDIVHIPLEGSGLEIRPALAAGGVGTAESFDGFLRRHRPLAAINGTFFSKKTLLPVGDVVANGKVLYRGRMGTAIAIRENGGVDFIRLPWGYTVDWSGYRHVLACGPTLVWEGEIALSPRGEGFRDPAVFARRPRSAVGVKADNTVVVVAVRKGASLEQLAAIMRRLGCRYAINLDGGGSVALAVGGKVVHRPSRRLTNVLLVTRKKDVRRQALALPRGLDWRDRTTAQAPGIRPREGEVPPGAMVLRWQKGKLILGPSQENPALLKVTGDHLPDGWHVELKSGRLLRGFISPPCTIPMANLMPEGGKMQVELVDSTGRKIDSCSIDIAK